MEKLFLYLTLYSPLLVLHLLNGDLVEAEQLKESMTTLDTVAEIGHLYGIRGTIYLDANEMLDAAPHLDKAIAATDRYYFYVYGKAKTIARLRRRDGNYSPATSEEISLFQEVVANHKFAVPQLLMSFESAIKKEDPEDRAALQTLFDDVLEDAWNVRDIFSVPALSRLGRQLEQAGQFQRSRKSFEMALSIEPDHGMTLHYYGGFLIRHGNGESDKKEGFEYLTKAGHPTAFTTFLQYFFNDRHAFEERETFPVYLEKFISHNKRLSFKRIFAYIGHKYYLLHGDIQQTVAYLQKAISFDLDNLTFDFKLAILNHPGRCIVKLASVSFQHQLIWPMMLDLSKILQSGQHPST